MLRWRLLIGAALIALLVLLFWLEGTQAAGAPPLAWLFPLLLTAAALGSQDLVYLYQARQWQPSRVLLTVGNLLLVTAAVTPYLFLPTGHLLTKSWAWPAVVFSLLLLLAFLREMREYEAPDKSVLNLSLTIFGWSYVGWLLTVLVELRVGQVTPAHGILAIGTLILFVKLGDTGAYTVGRLIGRHKVTPVLSPGKTWEGVAGAVVWAMLGGLVVATYWVPQLTSAEAATPYSTINYPGALLLSNIPLTARWIIYGGFMAIVGMLGDLAESLLKRDLGRKDSSDWLPGFGGTLDLLDSILFAGPFAYVVWQSGWLA
jgi:phosphatidate cytidylyltransferase